MALEENLQKLGIEKDLAKKHAIALTVLDELLQNITGQQSEQAKTEKGTKVSYGSFWYYREQTIKVDMPESGDVMRDVAQGLDVAADVFEDVFIRGGPRSGTIPVYAGEDKVPLFSFAFGFKEPKIFVPSIKGEFVRKYFDVLQFIADAKDLLSA